MEELSKRKKEIETEVEKLMEFLNSCGKDVGLNGKLVDNEGFPRSDIDLYAVRRARNRIAILNTDYTQLMKEIENKLIEIHSENKINVPRIDKFKVDKIEENRINYPFGLIDSILDNSPACFSGIKKGDIIIKFGDLYSEKEILSQDQSKELISRLSSIVLNNLNKPISITILRNKSKGIEEIIKEYSIHIDESNLTYKSIDWDEFKKIELDLIPKEWEGPGYLGCHIAYFHKFIE